MMTTRIREIACEQIVAQSTGVAYDAFCLVDTWILLSDFGLVIKAWLGVLAEFLNVLPESREI